MTEFAPADEIMEQRPSIRLCWRLLQYYMRGYHSIRIQSRCILPHHGPAILVCNHISALDPLILQTACPRLITWMMAKEYYHIPSLNWIFKLIGAIPVERSGRDLAATRTAMRALDQGQIIGIFPEGRIGLTHDIAPFQTGVALVAIKTGVPVYPACIEGTMRNTGMVEAFLYSQRGGVAFGPPIKMEHSDTSRSSIEAATNTIRQAVVALHAVYSKIPISPVAKID